MNSCIPYTTQISFSFNLVRLLRICSRALLLIALATARGVYFALEQPLSSTMRHFPDLVALGANIRKLLKSWFEGSLSGPYYTICWPVHA